MGVVPAAGRARRLGTPATSKEIEPVFLDPDSGTVRPVAYCLLRGLADSGVGRAIVVTSAAKADVRTVLGEGGGGVPRLDHVVVGSSPASTYSVAEGTRRAGDARIALGFPDVLWSAPRAFERLSAALAARDADAALGLFPRPADYATAGVRVSGDGLVEELVGPESAAGLPTWTLAAWGPAFSRFLEREVRGRYGRRPASHEASAAEAHERELTMSDAFSRALDAGMRIVGLAVSDRPFLDVGDPERLEAARAACRGRSGGGGSASR